jgi:phosphoglycerate dehydrogenase-like enzyme
MHMYIKVNVDHILNVQQSKKKRVLLCNANECVFDQVTEYILLESYNTYRSLDLVCNA